VGFFWIGHHRTFHYIKGYDRKLLMLNLWFLMWVALMPFSASILGEYGGERISVIVYASHMIIAGLFLSSLWWYASRDPRLMDSDIDPQVRRYNQLRALAVPSVFLLSSAVSFVNINAAEYYCWLLLFLVRPVLLRYVERDSRSQA
jgi:TMEM175 potassium channel family protein